MLVLPETYTTYRHLLRIFLPVLFALFAHYQVNGQTTTSITIDTVTVTGNRVTRTPVIVRELVFGLRQPYQPRELDSLIAKSRENLMNTLLFNFVEIDLVEGNAGAGTREVNVRVTERWYVWPVPILKISDRNFNVWWETRDLSRLSYGFYVDWKNFRGRKEHLILRLQFGFDQLYDFQYTIPFLNRKKTLGLGFGGGVWQQRESAVRTDDNRQVFYRSPGAFARRDYFAYGNLTIRRKIHQTHLFELRYDQHEFSDSLLAQNENFSVNGAGQVRYLTARYLFKSDHRDFRQYPLNGWYFDAELAKYGLWTFSDANTLDFSYILSNFRKYWQLHPRWFIASGATAKLSAGQPQPYFILKGIGYDRDIVRSYEYYVVDATHYGILRNNLKFALIPQKSGQFRNIRSERFGKYYYALYMNVFIDGGYGYYRQDFGRTGNDLQNELLVGYGAGIDFVSYYDIVIRMEFSVNLMREAGFFIHFRAPV
jgi:hypothetical protein